VRYILSIIFCAFLFACGHRENIPPGILPPEKMTNLIFDLSRVDDYATRFLVSKSQEERSTESIRMYQGIFALNGTDKEAFQKSLQYYKDHPESLRPVFDSLKVMENKPFVNEQAEPLDTTVKKRDSTISAPESKLKEKLITDTVLNRQRDSLLKQQKSKERIPRISIQ